MNKLLQEKIHLGQFFEAKQLVNKVSKENIFLILKELVYTEKLAVYSFVCFLLTQENNAVYHAMAAHFLALPLCAYEGAYSLGLFHAREAVRLDPDDVTNKELLLLFNRIPEHLLGKEEAIRIAKEILIAKPESYAAREVLSDYGIRL